MSSDEAIAPSAEQMQRVCAILQRGTGYDLSPYRSDALAGGIRQRMQIAAAPDCESYLGQLVEDPAEAQQLARAVLNGAPGERDYYKAYALLGSLLRDLLRSPGAEGELRVWVVGCGSGEDVYSITILLKELLWSIVPTPLLRVFGTDVQDAAIASARLGLYPKAVAERICPAPFEHFFERREGLYQIHPQHRKGCIFAPHDVLHHFPFNRLDLISCRGLLASLKEPAQQALLERLHRALRPGGYLLLTPGESPAAFPGLFRAVEGQRCLFQKNDVVTPRPLALSIPSSDGAQELAGVPLRPEAWLAAIVESSQDAIIGMDLDGTVMSFNPAAERLFGYPTREVVGRSISMFASPDAPVGPALEQLKAAQRVKPFEAVWLRKDGRPIDVELTFSPVADSGGAVVGAALSAHDISERKRTEKERAELQAALEMDRRKNEFLAVLGHELRNPLVPLRNAIEILQRPGAAVNRRALEMADRQLSHMTRLIDDLLDATRVMRGKVVLRKAGVDLVELVRFVVEDNQPGAAAAGVTLSASLPAQALRIFGDETRLAQAVGNLIVNAVKFTGAGGHVRVTLERQPSGGVVVRIEDTGIGMDPDKIAPLFQPFVQTDVTVAGGGLGLGLPLARGLVELHGGTLEAHSQGIGRGATFTIHVPAPDTAEIEAPASQLAEAPAPAAGPSPDEPGSLRILLVEDDPDVADSTTLLLECLGHSVRWAETGEGGVAMAKEDPPRVLICDIGLSGELDGHDVVRALRADPITASLYCIAMSGHGQDEDRRRSMAAGFDRHLTKPVSAVTLQGALAVAAAKRVA